MFLNKEELEKFTGCRTPGAQIMYLKSFRARHFVNANGDVLVTRPEAESYPPNRLPANKFTHVVGKGNSITIPRAGVGVYFLIKNANVVYVGKTTNLLRRISDHNDGALDFDSIEFIPLLARQLDVFEREYIARYCPSINVHHNNFSRPFVPQTEESKTILE